MVGTYPPSTAVWRHEDTGGRRVAKEGYGTQSEARLVRGRGPFCSLSADGDRYSGQASVDYRYSRDLLFDHQAPAPEGLGAALDVRVYWRGERLFLAVEVQDAWSRMAWRDAPFTRGGINSEGRQDDGFSLQPLFSGARGVSGFDQSMPRYTQIESRWQHGRWLRW